MVGGQPGSSRADGDLWIRLTPCFILTRKIPARFGIDATGPTRGGCRSIGWSGAMTGSNPRGESSSNGLAGASAGLWHASMRRLYDQVWESLPPHVDLPGAQMSSHVFTPPAAVSIPVHGTGQHFAVRRIYCVGRNYVEHAKEMGFTGREPPFFFMKPADAIVVVPDGETGSIRYPLGTSSLHHEIELVVAIGKFCEKIPAADAADHVYGYAIGLDMTRRDLQSEAKKAGRPWEIGKGFDQSAPIGPIHPLAATGWMDQGEIALQVNGKVTQASTVDKLIWNVAETIEHLSSYWALAPGDLIFTGTPEGVAAVVPGDLMVGSIRGLGELKVKVAGPGA